MEALAITLAIVLCAWVYASLHPSNAEARNRLPTWIVANTLFFGAIAAGVAAAAGL